MTWWLDSSDMVLVLGATTACITGIVVAWCQQQRKSRCSKLSLCWGCVSCDRTIESDDLILAEEALEKKSTPAPRERSHSQDESAPAPAPAPVSTQI